MPILLLAAAVAPVALMLHFVYIRDKYEREPMARVLAVYFIGFVSVIPAVVFQLMFAEQEGWGLWGVAFTTFCVVAFSEELVKYWTLRVVAVPHRSFNEVYDGIIYAVAASLGFATVENILYVLMSGADSWSVAAIRALLSVPGHALWGVMMGFYVGLAKFAGTAAKKRALVWSGVGMAIFWHGLYDFFAFGTDRVSDALAAVFLVSLVGVIAVNWIIGIVLIHKAQALSFFKRPSPMIDPFRALNPAVKFCHRCGRGQSRGNVNCTACGYEFPARISQAGV